MSEPPNSQDEQDHPGDQTQPTPEILAALNNVANSPVKSEPPPEVLTPTEYDALTAQLNEKSHNPEGWRRLVELAESSGEIEKIRATFDALLKQYPNTVCDPVSIHPSLVFLTTFDTGVLSSPI